MWKPCLGVRDNIERKVEGKQTELAVKLIEMLTKLEDEERSTETVDEGGSSEGPVKKRE